MSYHAAYRNYSDEGTGQTLLNFPSYRATGNNPSFVQLSEDNNTTISGPGIAGAPNLPFA